MNTAPEANATQADAAVQAQSQTETVVVSTAEVEAQNAELIAGKFKSQEDLVKAYKELESKLGKQGQQPATEEPAAEQPATEQAATEDKQEATAEDKQTDGDDPYAAYGEAVGSALKAAEVDPAVAAAEFQEKGTLSDETFEKFEKAGFPKEMVEAYLRGVSQSAEESQQITETQITQIKAAAGGEEGYGQLQQWMAANLSADELNAFNETIGSGNFEATLAAVASMNQRRVADLGVEGNLRSGNTAPADASYKTEAEYLEDIAKPEYKKSQAFRDQVAAKLAKSPNLYMTR